MNAKTEIQAEISALDAEFNRAGSTMSLHVWQQRRIELAAKLEDAARAAKIEALKNPPPPKAASSKPKSVYRMSDADRAELVEYHRKTETALESGDIDALVGMADDRRFRELMFEKAREEESGFSSRLNIVGLWYRDHQFGLLNAIRVAQARKTNKRLDDLTARLEALEAKPPINYRGVFIERDRYNRGDFCTWDGSVWYCKRDSVAESPSYNHDGNSPWQLAVKKGAPGKDAR